jgi:hypothetical protein
VWPGGCARAPCRGDRLPLPAGGGGGGGRLVPCPALPWRWRLVASQRHPACGPGGRRPISAPLAALRPAGRTGMAWPHSRRTPWRGVARSGEGDWERGPRPGPTDRGNAAVDDDRGCPTPAAARRYRPQPRQPARSQAGGARVVRPRSSVDAKRARDLTDCSGPTDRPARRPAPRRSPRRAGRPPPATGSTTTLGCLWLAVTCCQQVSYIHLAVLLLVLSVQAGLDAHTLQGKKGSDGARASIIGPPSGPWPSDPLYAFGPRAGHLSRPIDTFHLLIELSPGRSCLPACLPACVPIASPHGHGHGDQQGMDGVCMGTGLRDRSAGSTP